MNKKGEKQDSEGYVTNLRGPEKYFGMSFASYVSKNHEQQECGFE